jgi:hypothetical protein
LISELILFNWDIFSFNWVWRSAAAWRIVFRYSFSYSCAAASYLALYSVREASIFNWATSIAFFSYSSAVLSAWICKSLILVKIESFLASRLLISCFKLLASVSYWRLSAIICSFNVSVYWSLGASSTRSIPRPKRMPIYPAINKQIIAKMTPIIIIIKIGGQNRCFNPLLYSQITQRLLRQDRSSYQREWAART